MIRSTRLSLAAVLMALPVLSVTGCGQTSPHASQKESPMSTSSVSMERAIDQAMEMQREVVAALGRQFGHRSWATPPEHNVIERAFCNDRSSETVQLPSIVYAGTYPSDRWDDAVATVDAIARSHGYTDIKHVADRPGERHVVGLDRTGGSFTFAMSHATVFAIRVGCHRWAGTPYPGGQPLPD